LSWEAGGRLAGFPHLLESAGFLLISRTWKVLEIKVQGLGKAWYLPVVQINQHTLYV